jgi:glyoxylate/hydroxypyruvate reductase A
MTVAIYTKDTKESNTWRIVLKEELPNHTIEVYPSISDHNNVELLICWKPFHGLIAQFPNLKAIQSLGAGVDHIFADNIIDAHIQISKIVDDQLTQDMWEHVLSIVFSDMKNLTHYQDQQKQNTWKRKRYKSIKEITIGILGLGTIGSYVSHQFGLLGFSVLGWSRTLKEIENVNTFVGKEGIESISSQSDYLINILPLTKETKGILNSNLFSSMKPDGFLINVGRGKQLVEKDLIDALESGQLRGAALDVFHIEPLPENHSFWSNSSIQITPHIASLTDTQSVCSQVVENIKRLDAGLPLLNCVDIEKGY